MRCVQLLKMRGAPSIGLQKVVSSTSSMHSSVVSGRRSASISTSFRVLPTSAFSTDAHSTGSASSAAPCTCRDAAR